MPLPFQPFSVQHWVTLVIGTMVLLALLVAGRRGGKARVISTGLLAFANLTVYPLGVAAWLSLGGPLAPDKYLPLHPALTVAFPSWPFVMFFVQHFAVVAAALYLVLVDGWRPRQPLWRGPGEAFGWGVGYLCMVICVNRLLGTNFGFASHPPDNPSLLDHLGAWPWYLVSTLGMALVLFSLLALPFRRGRSGRPPL